MIAIQVNELTKKFNDFTAVDNISFEIEEGEIFGLLGPNGAGKTTTISMLSTMLPPSSGKAEINGHDIIRDQDGVRKSIGIVFQDQSLDEELTAYENMDFHGRLYRIPRMKRLERIEELLRLVGLHDRKDDLVKTFSGGMRRRLEIARGLLHHPKVLFLDEPTLGLDPQTRNHLWKYIENLNNEMKITIIITTHYMDEADRLCDRIAIIDQGRIIAMDTPENLKNEIGGDVITIKTPEIERAKFSLQAPWIEKIEEYNDFINLGLHNAEEHISDVVTMLTGNGVEISSLSVRKPTLEDVFLHFTGKTIREHEADSRERLRIAHRAWRR